jgi:ketosteroid isomerase-like protein
MAPKTRTEAPGRSTTVEQELIELETQFWQAMKDGDVEAALELSDEPCIVAGAQGVAAIDKAQFAQMMDSDDWILDDFRLDGLQVRQLSEDVAVVAYQVHEDMTVEGKPLALDAAETSVWVRRDGRWLCAVHTEALTGDPFGRDRMGGR